MTNEGGEMPMEKIKNMPIILYSTHCPQCIILENMLKELNISYIENNDTETMIEMGFKSVPMLQVNDKIMNMKDAMAWINNYKNTEGLE